MTPQLERHLIQMGVIPPTEMQAIEETIDPRLVCLAKGYLAPRGGASKMLFDDPRDPITGEVNH